MAAPSAAETGRQDVRLDSLIIAIPPIFLVTRFWIG